MVKSLNKTYGGGQYKKLYELLSGLYPSGRYDVDGSHYGLGLDHYCHCSSELRRAADIIVEHCLEVCYDKILKVIIETCYLTEEEIIKMTEICNKEKVDFIKTSTGFGIRGANTRDIEIINKYKSDYLKIKASGGIKNKDDAEKYIELGVSRIGTSNAVKIMEE
jgi:deoxyribose-phosphate aldolase